MVPVVKFVSILIYTDQLYSEDESTIGEYNLV